MRACVGDRLISVVAGPTGLATHFALGPGRIARGPSRAPSRELCFFFLGPPVGGTIGHRGLGVLHPRTLCALQHRALYTTPVQCEHSAPSAHGTLHMLWLHRAPGGGGGAGAAPCAPEGAPCARGGG